MVVESCIVLSALFYRNFGVSFQNHLLWNIKSERPKSIKESDVWEVSDIYDWSNDECLKDFSGGVWLHILTLFRDKTAMNSSWI